MSIYVSYLRVSTKEQGESKLGLEGQRAIIAHYFPDIQREFLEVKSGKNITERPILNEAISYCQNTGATLVIAKVDRLSRDVIDGLTVADKLQGKIKFCDLPGEVDRFTLTLYFAFAERERDLIRIRTIAALNAKRQRGEPMGSQITTRKDGLPSNGKNNLSRYEYKQSGAQAMRSKSVCDPENKKTLAYVLVLRDQGLTLRQIEDKLNESGHKTSTGGSWSIGSISKLIKRQEQTQQQAT